MVQSGSSETVFTYGAPQLKFGAGASDEIGYDLADVRRPPGAAWSPTPGVAATGHPQRIADQMAPFGIEAVRVRPARTSSRPTRACVEADRVRPRRAGPWDAFVAVGGGSAIDTAKAVNLLTHQPRRADGLRQRPGRQGPRAREQPLKPLVAVPTTTGTGSESTTICVLDVLALQGEDRHQPRRGCGPTLAVVDPDAHR